MVLLRKGGNIWASIKIIQFLWALSENWALLNLAVSLKDFFQWHACCFKFELISVIFSNWWNKRFPTSSLSKHDDRNSSECAPLSSGSPQRRDGDYIMYPAAQDGSRLNNRKYSPCSRRIFSEMIHFIKTEQPTCLSSKSA